MTSDAAARLRTRRRRAKRPTAFRDDELGRLRCDPGKSYGWCFAKKAGFLDVALRPQLSVLFTQPRQLYALRHCESRASIRQVGSGAFHPAAKSGLCQIEVARYATHALAVVYYQPYGLCMNSSSNCRRGRRRLVSVIVRDALNGRVIGYVQWETCTPQGPHESMRCYWR
jgi:hypothetical protein